ncbi:NusG domain II-containing protein [bacterium]|nr:NusG domain II-containing protein [bacterium]
MPLGKWEPDQRLRAADLIFIILMVTIVLFMFYRGITADTGRYALVYFKNEHILKIDLSKDKYYTVKGAQGDLHIRVSNGKLRIIETECRDKICMHRGDIFRAGERIICVPNEILIRIGGKGEVDAISG